MDNTKSQLKEMFEADQQNTQISISVLTQYGVYEFFERLSVLFDEILPTIQHHMPHDYFPFVRKAADGSEVPSYDFVLRTYMLLSAQQQFAYATGHLLRGHVSEVAGHVRRAIEGAGIAHLSKSKPELGEIFMSGDIKKLRNSTSTSTILPEGDIFTGPLKKSIEFASSLVHNNFISFVSRLENSFHMEDGKWTFSVELDLYVNKLQTILNTSLWLVRMMVRVFQLLAVSFDLPLCDWHKKLEQLYDEEEELRMKLEHLLNPDFQESN